MWKKNSFDGEIPTARPPFVGPQVRIPQKKGRGTSSRLSLSDRLQQNGGNIGSDQTPCNAVTCLDSAYASRFPLLLLLLLLSLSPPLSLSLSACLDCSIDSHRSPSPPAAATASTLPFSRNTKEDRRHSVPPALPDRDAPLPPFSR